jgi:ElaB/YqjD/DUF883 family membrane-anchored ribosome-binding protein
MQMNKDTMDYKNTNGAAAPKDQLMDDLRVVASDAQDLLRATASQAGEGAAAARARIQESLQVVKERLMEAEKALLERSKEAAKVTDAYVRENPWKSIGISACAGVIIGMLISRR